MQRHAGLEKNHAAGAVSDARMQADYNQMKTEDQQMQQEHQQLVSDHQKIEDEHAALLKTAGK